MHHKRNSLFHNSSFAIVCPVPYHPSCHRLKRGKSFQNKVKKGRNYHKQSHKINNRETVCTLNDPCEKRLRYEIRTNLFIHINPHIWPLRTFCLHVLAFGGLSNINCEHDDLGCHGWHLVAEAELVGSVHVCCNRVLATGLSVAFINLLSIRPCYLQRTQEINIWVRTSEWGHDIQDIWDICNIWKQHLCIQNAHMHLLSQTLFHNKQDKRVTVISNLT